MLQLKTVFGYGLNGCLGDEFKALEKEATTDWVAVVHPNELTFKCPQFLKNFHNGHEKATLKNLLNCSKNY